MNRLILLTKLLATIFFGTMLQAHINTKINLNFEDKINNWLVEYNVPAVGIGIIENGEVTFVKVFGELKKGVPAPDNTIFGVASMTKPVVAMLTLKLVEAGQWDLDEPLFHYWVDPDVANDPRHKKLTTRHVLRHQTGFLNWRSNLPTKKLAFEFEPGTDSYYSGEGFVYLQRALENKFKKSLAQLSDSVLFKPLGMKDTRYYWDENMDESRFALWHDRDGNLYSSAKPPGKSITSYAAGGLLMTVEDYCKFGIDVINGAGLSTDLFNDMISVPIQGKTKKHHGQGLSWFVVRDLPDGEYALEHSGSSRGIKTQAVFLPKSKRGIVVLTNGDMGMSVYMNVIKESLNIGETILDYMFKSSYIPEIITLSDEILERYVGTYATAGGKQFTLTREPGGLKIATGSSAPYILYPESENKFFVKDFDIQCEFFKDDTGQIVRMTIIQGGRITYDTKKIK